MLLKRLEISLLRKLMHAWDVFFTFIDNAQLKLYMKMKCRILTLTARCSSRTVAAPVKNVHPSPLQVVVDSNSVYGKINNIDVKFKISRGAGNGK